jgi:hypothetical protein
MAAFVGSVMCADAQQLLDRVVARVDGYAITLTDVRAAIALGLVGVPSGASEQEGVERVIDRQLMLSEVARFAPPEPAPEAIAREMTALTATLGGRLAEVIDAAGLDEAHIREMVRDNLRIEAYLNQRFGVAGLLTEDEVLQYYRIHPDEFTTNNRLMPFAEAEPLARQRAAAERRTVTVAQWLRDLRGRSEITRVSPPAALPAN